jgi:hypothetical protein
VSTGMLDGASSLFGKKTRNHRKPHSLGMDCDNCVLVTHPASFEKLYAERRQGMAPVRIDEYKRETDNERYSEPGQKADAGKAPLDLVPWDSVLGAAEVFGFGAKKYGAYNWYGLSKSRLLAAAFRHLIDWWLGEDLDSETGKPHTWHALCCVMMLASRHGVDDRREQ